MAFAQRISSHPVILVRHDAHDHQQASWFFVQVVQAKRGAFRRTLATGAMELTDFGTVLASGFGASPPAKTLARMQTFYGFKGE